MSYINHIDNASYRLEQKAEELRERIKNIPPEDLDKIDELNNRIGRIMKRSRILYDEVLVEEQIKGYYR